MGNKNSTQLLKLVRLFISDKKRKNWHTKLIFVTYFETEKWIWSNKIHLLTIGINKRTKRKQTLQRHYRS